VSSAVEYRDPAGGLWRVSEVARLNLVSPAIDGPNVFLVLRFEREGEERFVRWLGDPAWREPRTLGRLFELATRRMPSRTTGPASARLLRRRWRGGSRSSRRWGPTSSTRSRSARSATGTQRR